jgi:CIC family chloride channel protein
MEQIRGRRTEILILLVAAHAIGVVAGAAALLFERLLPFVQALVFDGRIDSSGHGVDLAPIPHDFVDLVRHALAPALGGLLLGLLLAVLPGEARGHGVAEVIEAVVLKGGRMRRRVGLLRMITATLTIGSGGSAGKEGPTVQIGAAAGSLIGDLFRLPARRRKVLLACGASAGIAAAFDAPFAGALFAFEILLGEIFVAAFAPILIAATVAVVLRRAIYGDARLFEVPAEAVDYLIHGSAQHAIVCGLLGVVAGLVSIAYVRAVVRTERIFERAPIPTFLRPAIGGLLVGLLGLAIPAVLGEGHGVVVSLLGGSHVALFAAVLVVTKIVATALTLGSGGTGGAFAPLLVIGAALGTACAPLAGLIPGIDAAPAAALAVVAMSAMLAGALHAPITAIAFGMAITGDYRMILLVMVATVASFAVSTLLERESLYTWRLKERGVDVKASREETVLRLLKVGDHRRPVPTIAEAAPFHSVAALVRDEESPLVAVVDDMGRVTGVLAVADVREFVRDPHVDRLVIAREIAEPPKATLLDGHDLLHALKIMREARVDGLLVVDPLAPRFALGVLSRRAVVDAYERALSQRAEEHEA